MTNEQTNKQTIQVTKKCTPTLLYWAIIIIAKHGDHLSIITDNDCFFL